MTLDRASGTAVFMMPRARTRLLAVLFAVFAGCGSSAPASSGGPPEAPTPEPEVPEVPEPAEPQQPVAPQQPVVSPVAGARVTLAGGHVVEGCFVADGAPDPYACTSDADCLSGGLLLAERCCMSGVTHPHSRAYHTWQTGVFHAQCDGTCMQPPSPPTACERTVRCVSGRCGNACAASATAAGLTPPPPTAAMVEQMIAQLVLDHPRVAPFLHVESEALSVFVIPAFAAGAPSLTAGGRPVRLEPDRGRARFRFVSREALDSSAAVRVRFEIPAEGVTGYVDVELRDNVWRARDAQVVERERSR